MPAFVVGALDPLRPVLEPETGSGLAVEHHAGNAYAVVTVTLSSVAVSGSVYRF
jgi:hypothetical protein